MAPGFMKLFSTAYCKVLLYIFLMSVSLQATAQNPKTDSLKTALGNAKHDTLRCSILSYMIEAENDDKIWPEYNAQLESIAEKNLADCSPEQPVCILYTGYLGDAWNNLGYLSSQKGNFTQALEHYEKSLQLRESIGDFKGIANSLNSMGLSNRNLGEYSKALELYQKSLTFQEKTGNKKSLANTLNNIGLLLSDQGDYRASLEYYEKSLKIQREIGNKSGEALTLNNIGFVHKNLGDNLKAMECYQKSLKIREAGGDKKGLALNLNNLGELQYISGNIELALEHYTKSMLIREELGDKSGIANSLNNIGALYKNQGDAAKALEYYEKCLEIHREIGEKKGIALALSNIGTLSFSQGDFTKAVEYYVKALEIQEKLNDKKGIATTLNNIGGSFRSRGEIATAQEYYRKSLAIRKEIGDKKGIAQSYSNIGFSYNKETKQFTNQDSIAGKTKLALDYHQKSLAIHRELDDKAGMSKNLVNIAGIYLSANQTDSAENYAGSALELSEKVGFPEEIKSSSDLLAKVYQDKGEWSEAESLLFAVLGINNRLVKTNFSILSEQKKELYFNTLSPDYEHFYSFSLLRKTENPAIAETVYNTALQNKGLLLKSSTAMRNAVMLSNDSALIKRYQHWIGLKTKISELYSKGKETKAMEDQANELEKELVRASAEFSDFDKIQKLSWKDVRDKLKNEEAAIEFIHFKHKADGAEKIIYCALILKKESPYPEMIPLFAEEDLQKILESFQGSNLTVVNGIYGSREKRNRALYDLIWKPLESSLHGKKSVYLSPSGLLHKVSFAAISKDETTYLCDAYSIGIQGSTGKIVFPENPLFNSTIHTTVFGGINYDTENTQTKIWKYLAGTQSETASIRSILEENRVPVSYFTQDEASEGAFKEAAKSSAVLHIATHGFFYPDPEGTAVERTKSVRVEEVVFRGGERGPGVAGFVENTNPLMRSGIVFAGANDVWSEQGSPGTEDGVLTAQEVADLDMRKTKLVVLSACETALGDIRGSEGVYGLQRSFKMAGVKFLIMSLWQVPDKETELFMTTFYKKLIKTKDLKKAFSLAQKEMKKNYDPYYWAAFVLVE